MAEWLVGRPFAVGLVTLILMSADWLLTRLQERERQPHYSQHYRTYPVDTIEGNPFLRAAVADQRIVEPKHLLPAIVLSAVVAYASTLLPSVWCPVFLGCVWGLFLIVGSSHLGNVIGYRVGRRGIHGKVWMHQRTAGLIQTGRYASLALLLVFLAFCSGSTFVAGAAVSGVTSSLRQFLWLWKLPAIPFDDACPTSAGDA